jgi:hypothetical protein
MVEVPDSVTNALALHSLVVITAVKSFMVQAPGQN